MCTDIHFGKNTNYINLKRFNFPAAYVEEFVFCDNSIEPSRHICNLYIYIFIQVKNSYTIVDIILHRIHQDIDRCCM